MTPRPLRTAALLMVGEELLAGRIVDTNSQWLASALAAEGVKTVEIAKVGDDPAVIAAALRRLRKVAGLVITSGGLGPTFDDNTFAGAARALGKRLAENQDARGWLEARHAALAAQGRTFTAAQKKIQMRQTRLPAGATALFNARGSAPGLWIDARGRALACLPGVPHEMQGLFEGALAPRLRARTDGRFAVRHYRFAPLPESAIESAIGARLKKLKNPEATVLAQPGACALILRARGRTRAAAEKLLEKASRELLAALPLAPYSDAGESAEQAVAARLGAAGKTLALAESLSGGALARRLTAIPGASRWLRGGMVAYTETAKRKLGVPAELLARHGAVSAEAAAAMAEAARREFAADFALATTGYAGPEGGDAATPVGGFFVALASASGTRSEPGRGYGARAAIQESAATHALALLLREWPPAG